MFDTSQHIHVPLQRGKYTVLYSSLPSIMFWVGQFEGGSSPSSFLSIYARNFDGNMLLFAVCSSLGPCSGSA